MVEEKGFYARAHQKVIDLIPMLKGETLRREEWYKLMNTHPTSIKDKDRRKAINEVLWNLSAKNKKQVISKNGSGFKVIDDILVPINFKDPQGAKFDLTLPFGLHKYGFLYKKNIMIVSGSKDAGKTSFVLNTIKLNMNKDYRTVLFSSEMVEDELKGRIARDDLPLEDWNFEAYERSYDIDQVIVPNALNLIDFLELGGDTEYYMGVGLVRRIYDKLDGGVAIIACQKNRDADLPKGGSGILEKARMAVSLDPGVIKLTVCKNWEDGVITSPRGKAWSYQLVGGIKILNVMETS